MTTPTICRHNRQLNHCAVCAPEAEAAMKHGPPHPDFPDYPGPPLPQPPWDQQQAVPPDKPPVDKLRQTLDAYEHYTGTAYNSPPAEGGPEDDDLSAERNEDTLRMDWLESVVGMQLCRTYEGGGEVLWWNAAFDRTLVPRERMTLRAAIDAARTSSTAPSLSSAPPSDGSGEPTAMPANTQCANCGVPYYMHYQRQGGEVMWCPTLPQTATSIRDIGAFRARSPSVATDAARYRALLAAVERGDLSVCSTRPVDEYGAHWLDGVGEIDATLDEMRGAT
jgi:hypothetical protein